MKKRVIASLLLISSFAQASYTAILCTATEIRVGGSSDSEPFWTQEFKATQSGKVAVNESFDVKGRPYNVSAAADGVLISLTTVTDKGEPVRGTGYGLIGVEVMQPDGTIVAVACIDQRK